MNELMVEKPLKVSASVKEKSKVTKEEWKEYTKTVWHIANNSHKDHPAVFPKEIPSRLIKLFSFWGETVLDPFAGTGTTGLAALDLGRKSICIDQNKDYINIIKQEAANNKDMKIVCGDSRNVDFIEDNSLGLIVTSPPYWDKADYGRGPNNLGNVQLYHEFLEEIKPVFRNLYDKLMPGRKLCLVTANVNQHTNHGLLTFPLATDFAVMLRDLGYVMVNEIIWSKDKTGGKWGSANGQRPIFGSYPYPPNFLFKNVHEYILIFAKPGDKEIKGPKVMPYEWLMGVETGE